MRRLLRGNCYVEGFKNNDVKLIDAIVRYPVAYLKDRAIEMRDRYPIPAGEAPLILDWLGP
jgi:hypothetical protein